jgi:hypothetical protein
MGSAPFAAMFGIIAMAVGFHTEPGHASLPAMQGLAADGGRNSDTRDNEADRGNASKQE